jgi:hypothetical protein
MGKAHRTCFFVLGLISTTVPGADLLEDYGWVPTTTTLGLTTGLCVPENINDFAKVSRDQSLMVQTFDFLLHSCVLGVSPKGIILYIWPILSILSNDA